MKLDLPQDATMSDIYKYVMEYTITHSLVRIPEHELHLFHRKLFHDLDFIFKHEFEIDAARKISHYFQKIRQENRSKGDKELTFHRCSVDRNRYSIFYEDLSPSEKISVIGSDPTQSGLRDAVADFGPNFCSSIWGYWSELADEGVPSSTTFETMISKGALVYYDIDSSDKAKVNVDNVGEGYVEKAKATLFFHAPDFVKAQSMSFEFVKETCWYGETHVVELTLIKLKPTSKLIARARAEFDFRVTKGFKVNTWAKVLSLGINCAFDTEKTLESSSKQFLVKFECFASRFKIKQKPDINISIQDAKEFLSFDQQMIEYEKKLGMKGELKQLKENRKKVDGEAQEMKIEDQLQELQLATVGLSNHVLSKNLEAERKLDRHSWLLYVTFKNGLRTIFSVKAIKEHDRLYTLEIAIRSKAVPHMDKAFRDTGVKKWRIVLDDSRTIPDLNNACSFAFEEIVNARVMAKAAEQGVPITCIEGDGVGQFTNAQGETVATPEYVDAVFLNDVTGDMISVQYKFSDTHWKVKESVDHWREHWKTSQDLSEVDVIVPKGLREKGKSNDVVMFSDKIVVEAPTADEVHQWYLSNVDKLKRIASESRNVKGCELKIEDLQKDIKKLKMDVAKKEKALSSGRVKDPQKLQENIDSLKKRIDDFDTNLARARNEKLRADAEIDRVIAEDGLNAIPGVESIDLSENRLARQAELDKSVANAKEELTVSVRLAIAITAATEIICSLMDEVELWREGKQSLGEAALHVITHAAKPALVGIGIGLGISVVQYGLSRMAIVESSSLVASFGTIGSKVFGPALIAASVGFQSYAIISQYNQEKEFAPSVAKKRMRINFARMAGVTIGSVGCFALAGVGAVGAVCCIAIGVVDHLVGMLFNFDLQAYKELRPKVIHKAYSLFDLEPHCSDKELRKAYHAALRKYHPDKAKNKKEANDITQAILTAYTLLITVRAE